MSGEMASGARIVGVADEDSSWYMLIGEQTYFGSFVVVLVAAISLCRDEICAEMQP
ncbi:hypothetical protein L195_g062499, partial [Trifolium pratense]